MIPRRSQQSIDAENLVARFREYFKAPGMQYTPQSSALSDFQSSFDILSLRPEKSLQQTYSNLRHAVRDYGAARFFAFYAEEMQAGSFPPIQVMELGNALPAEEIKVRAKNLVSLSEIRLREEYENSGKQPNTTDSFVNRIKQIAAAEIVARLPENQGQSPG